MAPSRQLDRRRRGREGRLAGRLDRREHVRGRRRDRRSQLVPPGVRMARCLPVAEPVVPPGDVAAAARRGRGTPRRGAPGRRPRAAGRGSRRSRAASGRPSAWRWQAKLTMTASGVPSARSTAITPTVSSTGRSGTTRLTVIPGRRCRPRSRRVPASASARRRRRRRRSSPAGARRSGRTPGASRSPATLLPRERLGALWLWRRVDEHGLRRDARSAPRRARAPRP